MAANEALIAARVAQRSRSRPRHPLSRKELADLVNRYVWDEYRQQTPVDENYIGKLERGDVRWPGAVYREAIVAILGVAHERDLGFRPSRAQTADSTQPAGAGAPMSMVGASTRLLDVMAPMPWPARIDRTWQAARTFSMWDNLYGGLAREAPVAQLRWSAGLIEGPPCPAHLRAGLLSAVGHHASTCGCMVFDSYAFERCEEAAQLRRPVC